MKSRGAALDGVDRVLDRPVAGDHDGDDARVTPDRGFMTRAPSMPGIRRSVMMMSKANWSRRSRAFFAALGLDDLEPALPESLRHERPQRSFVVDEENVRSWTGHGLGALIC